MKGGAEKKEPLGAKEECPIKEVAQMLSDTWTMLIIRALNEGPKRFCDLERWLEGISTRTLTLKLQRLQELELIEKSPEGVYHTTPKGHGLKIIERAMITYRKQYL